MVTYCSFKELVIHFKCIFFFPIASRPPVLAFFNLDCFKHQNIRTEFSHVKNRLDINPTLMCQHFPDEKGENMSQNWQNIHCCRSFFNCQKKKKNQIVAPNTILSYQISLALNWSLNGVGSSSRFAFHTLARPA